jgi:hypothetical protein
VGIGESYRGLEVIENVGVAGGCFAGIMGKFEVVRKVE